MSCLPATLQVLERGWLSSNSIVGFEPDGSASVVDSGYAGHAAQTVDLLRGVLAGRPLKRLLNTHSHSDHIGGNAALQRAFGCAILVPAGMEGHVAGWDEEALFLAPSDQRGERFAHDGVIADGERFILGGFEWQAHAAPGHDMTALVFHCPSERLLISGDALWEDGFGAVFAEILGTGPGLASTRQTLAMIAGLAVDTVIPGHGPVFGEVPAALGRAERRLQAFADDPKRMARSAIKACFTFNLLDRRRLPLAGLADYLAGVPFFRDVGAHTLGMAPPALAEWLLAELLRAGAVAVVEGEIVPTMAA